MAVSFQITINKRQGQNQYYEELLAKGDRPSESIFIPGSSIRGKLRFNPILVNTSRSLEMMRIPAGSFLMGSPENELERSTDEGPQHEVVLSQFFLAKYPITQAQWRVIAAMPQVNRELKADPSHFKGDDLPVEQVSWYEAVEFCDRLTLATNRQYRLPTEAEWEYACRAGTTTPFHFGETITTDLANYCGEDEEVGKTDDSSAYSFGYKGKYRKTTTPVEQFDVANAFGLCDMHGNVLEWCQDYEHESYKGVPTDGSAWLTKNEEALRILRGGSWEFYLKFCRSAQRSAYIPDAHLPDVGFRVSCSAPRI
jgi:formylglycine-generating enzyme required for sulfatase activity